MFRDLGFKKFIITLFGVQQISHSPQQQNHQTERLHTNSPLFCFKKYSKKQFEFQQKNSKKKRRKNGLSRSRGCSHPLTKIKGKVPTTIRSEFILLFFGGGYGANLVGSLGKCSFPGINACDQVFH